jgi:hypothetical protein
MTRVLLSVVVLAGMSLAAASQDKAAPRPASAVAEVNFSEHIAPIIFNNCASCHRPGESAPFCLLSYQDTRKRAKLIQQVTERRYMPPWHPAPGHGEFMDDRRLSDEQIALIKRWSETGTAEGDVAKLPKLPKFPEGWPLGTPDLVVTMEKPYTVPATGRDIYAHFTLPVKLPEDKWLTAIDLRASSKSVVHHVLLFASTGGKGGKGKRGGALGGLGGFGGGNSLGGWVPGTRAQHLPKDLAMPFPKGSSIALQTHFHPSGKVEQEKTSVALYFAKKKPERTLITLQAPPLFGVTAGINIPAGTKDYTVKGKFKAPVDMELISVMGHAHYVCESMKATATLPDGATKSLIYIPRWDFNWQSTYLYKEPAKLPKGTVIDVVMTYNNSAENPANPFSPPKRIKWGTASTDEMGSVIFGCVAARETEVGALRNGIRAQLISSFVDGFVAPKK